MDFAVFLQEHEYIDFSSTLIIEKAKQLFNQINTDVEKAKIAFEYVRDEIPHSFDIGAKIITAKASNVLKYQTGICHAKANLLAALLRTQGIPAGMCFQHITLADDDSLGYCVHCFNAIYVDNHWIKVDARGNTNGKNAQFSLDKPILAFPNRQNYNEFFWPGIYANPHKDTMKMLDNATCIQDILDNIPDYVDQIPDITY
ncbi:transglutaminase family protein [Desulfosporosinus sp. OT]|uniref:transglutaminase-like domain-containing protein n=1 Tax=Desulfosporosinus sp. OT TaxID=913865 RepID=UPI000223ACFD|nr:transglutaminase family protein [Desulfosporosinus sp. OT]EGW41783.1 ABC transporter, ATP-binding protein [Desulfosporosinus sp. OT]